MMVSFPVEIYPYLRGRGILIVYVYVSRGIKSEKEACFWGFPGFHAEFSSLQIDV
jgi:hypothetical protein